MRNTHKCRILNLRRVRFALHPLPYTAMARTPKGAPAGKKSRRRRPHHAAADCRVGVNVCVQIISAGDHQHVPVHLVPHTVPAVRREAFDLHRARIIYDQTTEVLFCWCVLS